MLMDYKLIYEKIIARAKNRTTTTIDEYTEKHHIIPRCMGGDDEKENIVILTPEEHYVCHQLLVKIYPEHVGLWKAVKLMTGGNDNQDRSKNKMYGWLKRKIFYQDSRVVNICKLCSKPFKAYESAKRVYCSLSCRTKLGQLREVQIGKKEHNCKTCNKVFLDFECCNRKFCSVSCKNASQENKIEKKCKHCENDFFVTVYEAKKRKYCSPKCSSLSKINYLPKCSSLSQIKISIKNCKNCKKEFCCEPCLITKRTFCSLKCVGDFQKGKKRFVPERVPVMSKPCKYCGELIYDKPGKLKQKKSCGRSCGAKVRWAK